MSRKRKYTKTAKWFRSRSKRLEKSKKYKEFKKRIGK